MIGRVSGTAQASVHLHDFCEVVCRASFPNREGREALEIGSRLNLLQKAVSGKGLQIEYSPQSDETESILNKFFDED
eukprot:g28272.t1